MSLASIGHLVFAPFPIVSSLGLSHLPKKELLLTNRISSNAMDHMEYMEEAPREYRESSWDDRDFRNLPPEVQLFHSATVYRSHSIAPFAEHTGWRAALAAYPHACAAVALPRGEVGLVVA